MGVEQYHKSLILSYFAVLIHETIQLDTDM